MSQEQILQIIAELSRLREENGQLKEENAYLKFKLEEFNAKRPDHEHRFDARPRPLRFLEQSQKRQYPRSPAANLAIRDGLEKSQIRVIVLKMCTWHVVPSVGQ